MQRIAALGLTALLAGCASGSGSLPEARTDRAIVPVEMRGTTTSTVEIARTAAIASEAVEAPAARVWALLPAVYAEMEIPVASADAEAMVIGCGDGGADRGERLGAVALREPRELRQQRHAGAGRRREDPRARRRVVNRRGQVTGDRGQPAQPRRKPATSDASCAAEPDATD